jgi:hypothetical protein
VCIAAVLLGAATARAVLGGVPDGGAHPYVGEAEQALAGGGIEVCSGSLLSPTVFVTAAHCFPDGSTVQVSFDENAAPGSSATWFAGTVHVDPDFCLVCGNGLKGADTADIAVVVFADAGAPRQRYAQLPALGADDALNGAQVDVVGYGAQGISHKTVTTFGTREIATTTVTGNGALSSEFLKLTADPGACFGDSGGPDLVHGSDTMAAITSFSGGNPSCNGVAYSERLDTEDALAFIEGFLAAPRA